MPITSNAGAKICGTRAYGGLLFVPDIDLRILLIAAFSEFSPSTPSLTVEPAIDHSSFILNQMVQNWERFKRSQPAVQYCRKNRTGASWSRTRVSICTAHL